MSPQSKYIYKLFRQIYHQINHAKPTPNLNQYVELSKNFLLTTQSLKSDFVCSSYALICAQNKQHLNFVLLTIEKMSKSQNQTYTKL